MSKYLKTVSGGIVLSGLVTIKVLVGHILGKSNKYLMREE